MAIVRKRTKKRGNQIKKQSGISKDALKYQQDVMHLNFVRAARLAVAETRETYGAAVAQSLAESEAEQSVIDFAQQLIDGFAEAITKNMQPQPQTVEGLQYWETIKP